MDPYNMWHMRRIMDCMMGIPTPCNDHGEDGISDAGFLTNNTTSRGDLVYVILGSMFEMGLITHVELTKMRAQILPTSYIMDYHP